MEEGEFCHRMESFQVISLTMRNRDKPLMLLTKGDNNAADDTELYAPGQRYLNRKEDVIGNVIGFIPTVGYVTIMLSEHPWLKSVMLGIMGLMVILQRE
jgi:signal peptidase